MDGVSTIFGTHDAIFYPDTFADWKIKDWIVDLKMERIVSHGLTDYVIMRPIFNDGISDLKAKKCNGRYRISKRRKKILNKEMFKTSVVQLSPRNLKIYQHHLGQGLGQYSAESRTTWLLPNV